VDHLFCILPFEVDFYKRWDMKVDYVGNPLLDAISAFKPDPDFRGKNRLTGKKIVALLPGSRRQEISLILPATADVMENFPDHRFVIAGAPSFDVDYYEHFLKGKDIPVIFNATYDLLSIADAAIVTSGTATLETALFHVPQVVVYRGNPIFINTVRVIIKVKFISLVNLIMDRLVVKELIQGDCNPQTIGRELDGLLHNAEYRQEMLGNYDELDEKMGKPGASLKTAKLIVQYTQERRP
jgi:lipid-A-disaccharide synthase